MSTASLLHYLSFSNHLSTTIQQQVKTMTAYSALLTTMMILAALATTLSYTAVAFSNNSEFSSSSLPSRQLLGNVDGGGTLWHRFHGELSYLLFGCNAMACRNCRALSLCSCCLITCLSMALVLLRVCTDEK